MNKDYIELEYIESTGTQQIETNFQGNIYVEGTAQYTETPKTVSSILFGQTSGGARWFGIIDGKFKNGDYIFSSDPLEKFSFSMLWNFNDKTCSNTIYINEESSTRDGFTSSYPIGNLSMFNAWNSLENRWSNPSKAKLYSFTIYQDITKQVKVAEFVPVKRKSDNEVGLYDTVNDLFYTNSGTGEFIAGPEINLYRNVSLINTQISNLKSLTDEILGTTPGPEIVPFATATDAQISALLDAHYAGKIDLSEVWNVGDTRVIHINELTAPVAGSNIAHVAQDMTFRIIGFNHDNLTTQIGSVTKAAVTIECKELLGNNGSNERDYLSGSSDGSTYENPTYFDNAYRRTWLNNNFIDALPSTFKVLVKEVIKRNLQGHNDTTSYIETNDKAFLLSYPEMFSSTWSKYRGGAALNDFEGTQYAYYSQNESNSKRVKYINNNGSASLTSDFYWLRSPASDASYFWCYMTTSGSAGNSGYFGDSYGVAPALAI